MSLPIEKLSSQLSCIPADFVVSCSSLNLVIHSRGLGNHGLIIKSALGLILQIKFYWNMATSPQYGCFHAPVEWRSHQEYNLTHKPTYHPIFPTSSDPHPAVLPGSCYTGFKLAECSAHKHSVQILHQEICHVLECSQQHQTVSRMTPTCP